MSDQSPKPVENSSFVRAAAIWLMTVSAGFTVVFFGMSYASQRLPADLPAPAAEQAAAGAPGSAMPAAMPAAAGPGAAPQSGAWPAPDFRLPSLDGQSISPADFKGDVVVIELWASWCGPCRIQARFLEELHKEFDGRGVHFLAINSGESETTARAYQQKTPFPYPVLLDPRETVRARYRSRGLPTLLVVDRSGAVSMLKAGVVDVNTLRREIQKAMQAA